MQATLCSFCMKMVQSEICPYCGRNVNYAGHPTHLPVGYTLIGHGTYVLGAALGQGGFGITYIALNPATNLPVAIKEYYPNHCCARDISTSVIPSYGQEETFTKGKQHFILEAQMLQSLSDLGSVVKVLDYFEANNSAYLVMEYLDGMSLKDHVEKNGKLPAQEFLVRMKPLMADMEKMHQRGVVHRDIAPDNIIMLSDGRLKLIDFGAARSYVGDKSMTVVVKKGFAPVEQYMRKGSNASTDVYALAATIYYCITGIIPPDSAERQYGETTLQAPTSLGILLSREQERGLEKALEIQPKERTQAVSELAKALEQAPKPVKPKAEKNNTSPQSKQAKPVQTEPKKKAKWWIPVAAALVLCVGIGMLLMGTTSKDPSPSQISVQKTIPENVVPEDVVNVLAESGETTDTQKPFWGQSIYDRRDIVTVAFVYTLKDAPENAVDVSARRDGSILAWMTDGNLTVASNGHIALNPNSSQMFYDFVNLESIAFGDYLDTSLVTDMSQMFGNCNKLEELDLSCFDTSNVTDMSAMFYYCEKLQNLNLHSFDTSNVTKMNRMFLKCTSLETLNIESFDTSKVINMSEMFSYCQKMQALDVSEFDKSSVTDMSDMFAHCSGLKHLDLSGFNTENVTNMNSMFSNCTSLSELDLSSFKTDNVTEMRSMFRNCFSLSELDLSNFDTSNVRSMHSMFYNCISLSKLNLSSFNTENVTNMNSMFSHCTSLSELDISSFNTKNVTNMTSMFESCSNLTELNLNHFNYSNVRAVDQMFKNCARMKRLYLKGFYWRWTQSPFSNCPARIYR